MAPDIPARLHHVVNDAKTNAMLVAWDLLKDLELKPDDELTVDVRILVQRRKGKTDMGRCCS